MKVIADFHLHSRYSRATSRSMDIRNLSKYGSIKGLNLIGTGDFTHPKWLKELKENLKPFKKGIFEYNNTYFMLTCEISTVYNQDGLRKVHHVIHSPDFETVEQINEALSEYGSLRGDGRPVLNMTSPELVERLMKINSKNFIYPGHAWTPWFGVFGSNSGFDSLKECYQDQMKHIHALETGLSSDPPINWRLSSLDNITLLSNSDSHSPWPWRIGREANAFDLKKLSYDNITKVIKNEDMSQFKFTIEVDPSYGKYHYDGHRKCNVRITPKQAMDMGNTCPVCGRKLTLGVEHRVEELADRKEGYRTENKVSYKSLIPLGEIIAKVFKTNLYSKKVWEISQKLINNFGSEFNVLLDVKKEDMGKIVDRNLVKAIIDLREGRFDIIPGYDGVYGKLIFDKKIKETNNPQKTLSGYFNNINLSTN